MKKKYMHGKAAAEMNLTPMIDVTFLLLVFFLVGTRFKEHEGTLDAKLPKDRGPGTALDAPEQLTIKVLVPPRREGAIYQLGELQYSSVDGLERKLRSLYVPGLKQPVTIDSDPAASCDSVTQALNACIKVGYADMAFAAPAEHTYGRKRESR